ncbi:MAG: Unknown protein [uncultured Sulfurovum sp.]|uniref:Ribonuclease VapC n=1 Tax=uncultured Sulfurovum sp. TaxID=269237 RepID=A0A6S6S8F7_9BACT|nr:MAG: Unknown protein [uncultured Sulfurovum sp.]
MIYLDTNVLLYATLSKVDTQSQQDRAIEILKDLIDNETLLLSNLNLLEYAFVMKKAREDSEKIENALQLFQSFVQDEQDGFKNELVEVLNNDYAYKNSFDLYHVTFANSYKCQKLLTFDKGFKKFVGICDVDIEIL